MDQATRAEARDFSRWIQIAVKPGHAAGPGDVAGAGATAAWAGVPNPVTGKAPPGSGYAPATVTHSESVLRGFYDFHLEAGTGPIVNRSRWPGAGGGGLMRTTTRCCDVRSPL